MSMIEKAARAIAENYWSLDDEEEKSDYVDSHWIYHIDDARAALQEMREPDDAMRLASKRYKRAAKVYSGPECYRQMIDAALSQPK